MYSRTSGKRGSSTPAPNASMVPSNLPAIIHDESFTTKFFCQPALFLYLRSHNLLVKAIPGRIHRETGGLGNARGLIAGLGSPPVLDLFQALVIRDIARIDAQHRFVSLEWR